MMQNNHFKIMPYSDNIAASLAQMWNESDGEWPGTFTRGVPLSEERIVKWMAEVDYLLNLVIVGENGKVVGYGNLRDTTNQTGVSCYVPLLNVHPQFQGKSLCRRMLNQMVDKATELGYQRMTIGTWSGNIKSVPLYKKVGFFWTPGTSVHMENYIPAVRQLPIAQKFFTKADWYQDFKRDLTQVEDDIRHHLTCNMKVFTARWEKGNDFIEVTIDREGQSITGVETPQFAAYAVVDESYPAKGFRYGIHWHLENRAAKPVSLALKADGAQGIDVQFEKQITLAAGETRKFESSFVCTMDTPAIDLDETREVVPRPHIQTAVSIDDESFTLATGLCYRPAVELNLEPETVTLLPGEEKTVLLQIRSRAKRPLSGTIALQHNQHISTSWTDHPFDIDSEGYAGIPVSISGDQVGGHVLNLAATMPDGFDTGETVSTETAVLCQPLGALAAVEMQDKIVIENDFYQVNVQKKGGGVKVWDKVSHKRHLFFREEIGPPFDPNDLEKREYSLSLHQQNGHALVTFHIESGRFPGLHIKREVLFTPSPLMQVSHTLENFNTKPTTCTVLFRVGMNETIHGNGRSYIPHANRILSNLTSLYPTQSDDFPSEPEKITEQWAAFEVDGQTHGVIWSEASKHNLRWGMMDLHANEVTLNPGEHITLAPAYVYCGSGSWKDVRRIWQRITGKSIKTNAATAAQLAPTLPYKLSAQPAPVITLSNQIETTLTAENAQKLALNGTVKLELPTGWQANRTMFEVDNVEQGEAWQQSIQITAPKVMTAATAVLHISTPRTNLSYPVALLRLGDEQETVRVQEGVGIDGKLLLTLGNGRFTWLIAPAYHGGIVAWHDSSDTNHLLTNYPEQHAPFAHFTPFHGGIEPKMINMAARDWFGKLYEESFTHQHIEVPDVQSLPWRGVRLTAQIQREMYKGLRAELEYVTLPGSNVLKAVFRLVNETAVYRTVHPELFAYCQIDGSIDNSEIIAADYWRKRTKESYWEWHPCAYAAVVNTKTERTLVMVKGNGRPEMFLLDMGEFGSHVAVSEEVTIPPQNQHELIAYLAMVDSAEAAVQYAALADL
jgi:RimJ/RimL family protein N-acetyltransferase